MKAHTFFTGMAFSFACVVVSSCSGRDWPACTPMGAETCEGDTVMQCTGTPLAWTVKEDCAATGLVCKQVTEASAECSEQGGDACPAQGDETCQGDLVMQCTGTPLSWEEKRDCASIGRVCEQVTSVDADCELLVATFSTEDAFSTTENPFGVWSYGWSQASTPISFAPFDTLCSGVAGLIWYHSSLGSPCGSLDIASSPHLWKNTSDNAAHGVMPGQLSLHAGKNEEFASLRWTAPAEAHCQVHVKLFQGDAGETEAYVIRDGTIEMAYVEATSVDPVADVESDVVVGTTLDFLVGQVGTWDFGNTPIEVTLSCQ